MLSQRSADNTTVKENFGGIGDAIKDLDSLFILLIVVVFQGQHPSFDFLYVLLIRMDVSCWSSDPVRIAAYLLQGHRV